VKESGMGLDGSRTHNPLPVNSKEIEFLLIEGPANSTNSTPFTESTAPIASFHSQLFCWFILFVSLVERIELNIYYNSTVIDAWSNHTPSKNHLFFKLIFYYPVVFSYSFHLYYFSFPLPQTIFSFSQINFLCGMIGKKWSKGNDGLAEREEFVGYGPAAPLPRTNSLHQFIIHSLISFVLLAFSLFIPAISWREKTSSPFTFSFVD